MQEIFEQGIAGKNATFETEAPSWEAWDRSQLDGHRGVAVEQERVVGWVAAHPVSSRPCYRGVVEHSVYVHDDWQGKGIGRALLRQVTDELVAMGYSEAVLWVVPENARARALYESEGWSADGSSAVEEILGVTVTDIRYRKPLISRAAH